MDKLNDAGRTTSWPGGLTASKLDQLMEVDTGQEGCRVGDVDQRQEKAGERKTGQRQDPQRKSHRKIIRGERGVGRSRGPAWTRGLGQAAGVDGEMRVVHPSRTQSTPPALLGR